MEQNALAKQPDAAMVEKSLQVVEIQTDSGPVRLTPSVVRRYLAVGQIDKIKDSDVTLFMATCKFNQLNPFLREAWLIKYGDTAQMVVSKEAFVKRAEDSPDLVDWQAGIIVWDPDEKRFFDTSGIIPPGTELIGAWCKVLRKSRPEFRLEVNLDEYLGQNQQMWGIKGKRATMIRKVAVAQALREAFPSRTKRMYIPDEMGLDPDKLPEGAIDVEQVRHDALPPTDKPNDKDAEEAAPTEGLPKRSRRNKFTGLDKNIFPGGKIETCGVRPEQLIELKKLAALPENAGEVKAFLTYRVGYPELSYLREDEALNLAGRLAPLPVEGQTDDFDPPASAFEQPKEQLVDDPIPGDPIHASPEVRPEETVICPFTKEVTYKSFCKQACKTRATDGFCIALGEKPPRANMLGQGGAA